MNRKVIIFGGSFDPIHNGHIGVARYAIEHFNADELIFVPAKRSPHKHISPKATGEDRYNMIEIATAGDARLRVSDCELKRPEPSFTIDTILELRGQHEAGTIFYMLIGADGLAELHRWYRVRELLEMCNISVMYRPGFDLGAIEKLEPFFGRENVYRLKENVLPNPEMDVSSTEIRHRLAAGEDVGGLLPPGVVAYIHSRKLYGT